MRPDGPRDPVTGPDNGPESPYPIRLSGPVIRGFGRGSKELGIPTANIPPSNLSQYPDLQSGVYYGFIGLSIPGDTITNVSSDSSTATSQTSPKIHDAVLSIGYNPFYKNQTRSIEIHVLHDFGHDFYGAALNLLILGFIRPEYDYVSVDSLIEDIRTDCRVAKDSLARPAYQQCKSDKWLMDFDWLKHTDVKKVEEEVLAGK